MGYPLPNRALLLSEPNGIRFEGGKKSRKLNAGGVAYTLLPLRYPSESPSALGAFSIELWVEAAREENRGVGTIAVFCDDRQNAKLLLGQWQSHLIIRSFFFSSSGRRPWREIGVRDILAANEPVIITVTSTTEATSVFVNGREAGRFAGSRLLPPDKTLAGHRLYLGNEPQVPCPWNGSVYGLSLYSRGLTAREMTANYRRWTEASDAQGGVLAGAVARYSFDRINGNIVEDGSGSGNDLVVPARFNIRQPFLAATNLYEADVSDIIVNFIGFVPLGFFLLLWVKQKGNRPLLQAALQVILMGCLLSLGIELAQAYLPTRNSAMIDLVMNSAGTVAGVVLCLATAGRR